MGDLIMHDLIIFCWGSQAHPQPTFNLSFNVCAEWVMSILGCCHLLFNGIGYLTAKLGK